MTESSELFAGFLLGAASAIFAWMLASLVASVTPAEDDE